jgi:rhamnogalacturonan hydrolase
MNELLSSLLRRTYSLRIVGVISPCRRQLTFTLRIVWCNQSGGCSFGSLGRCDGELTQRITDATQGVGTAISNIEYRFALLGPHANTLLKPFSHIYANGGIHAMLFKSGGGSGYVKNISLHDFIARGTTFGLRIDQVSMNIRSL